MRTKHIQLDAHVPTGERTVQFIDRRDTGLSKYASYCDDSLAALRTTPAEPGHTLALVIAMTAFEYYGFNRNGDGFNERELSRVTCDGVLQTLVYEDQSLPYYYKTFETSGNNFLNHQNKDPNKRVGRVVQAFYNWKMHRVEVILAVANDKAFRVVERLKDGDFPAVSMGCHIPYDVCYVCGNRAPTRAQYCIHASGYDPKYGLTTLLADGVECGVLNPCPELFDLSWVFRPADRVAYTISAGGIFLPDPSLVDRHATHMGASDISLPGTKTASATGAWDTAAAHPRYAHDSVGAKMAALAKLSDMDKYVHGDVASIQGPTDTYRLADSLSGPPCHFADDQIRTAAGFPVQDFVETCAHMAVVPSVHDIYRVVTLHAGEAPDPRVQAVLGSIRSAILRAFAGPGLLDLILDDVLPDLGCGCVQPKLAHALSPGIHKRALAEDYLMRRYVPESLGNAAALVGADPSEAYYGSPQKKLVVKNPTDGSVYETQRLTAEKTDLSNKKRIAAEAGVLAGLTGIGVGALSLLPKSHRARAVRLPLAGAGAVGTGAALTNDVQRVYAEDGTAIPINTPMVKVNSLVATDLGQILAWAQDAQTCIPSVTKAATVALHRIRDRHFDLVDGVWHATHTDKHAFVADAAAAVSDVLTRNFLALHAVPS